MLVLLEVFDKFLWNIQVFKYNNDIEQGGLQDLEQSGIREGTLTKLVIITSGCLCANTAKTTDLDLSHPSPFSWHLTGIPEIAPATNPQTLQIRQL